MHIDEQRARNSQVTVKLVPSEYSDKHLQVPTRYVPAPIRIRESSYEFHVVGAEQPVIQYKTYSAKGGWLIRLLGISEGDAPLLLGDAFCAPKEQLASVISQLNVSATNWK